MNRTLLVEEGDDEAANRQDKKKREKEKFPDAAGMHKHALRLFAVLHCASLLHVISCIIAAHSH